MRIIITGNSGFIGSNLTERLIKDNYIIGIDKDFESRHRLNSVIPKTIQQFDSDANYISNNLTMIWDNILSIRQYYHHFEDIDTIYHLAASSDIRKSSQDTEWDLENNVIGTHCILEMMREKDIKNIVFTSTSAVYGENPIFPTPETEPLIVPSLYAASKVCAEFLIRSYCEVYGFKGCVLRFGNVVGRNQHRGVIVDFIKKLKDNPKELKILGDGKQIKSYVHVSDCINALIEIPKKVEKFDIFNIATLDQINVDKVASIVTKELKVKPKYRYTGGRSGWKGDIPCIQLSIRKALYTGWSPKYMCEDAVKLAARELNDKI